MARVTKEETAYFCDLCGKPCTPIGTIEIPVSYFMDLVNKVTITINAYVPYGTSCGDVCKSCAIKAVKGWLHGQQDGNTEGRE